MTNSRFFLSFAVFTTMYSGHFSFASTKFELPSNFTYLWNCTQVVKASQEPIGDQIKQQWKKLWVLKHDNVAKNLTEVRRELSRNESERQMKDPRFLARWRDPELNPVTLMHKRYSAELTARLDAVESSFEILSVMAAFYGPSRATDFHGFDLQRGHIPVSRIRDGRAEAFQWLARVSLSAVENAIQQLSDVQKSYVLASIGSEMSSSLKVLQVTWDAIEKGEIFSTLASYKDYINFLSKKLHNDSLNHSSRAIRKFFESLTEEEITQLATSAMKKGRDVTFVIRTLERVESAVFRHLHDVRWLFPFVLVYLERGFELEEAFRRASEMEHYNSDLEYLVKSLGKKKTFIDRFSYPKEVLLAIFRGHFEFGKPLRALIERAQDMVDQPGFVAHEHGSEVANQVYRFASKDVAKP